MTPSRPRMVVISDWRSRSSPTLGVLVRSDPAAADVQNPCARRCRFGGIVGRPRRCGAPDRPGTRAGTLGASHTARSEPMERLLLLDGNGLIYRGYFALIEQPLTTSKGELVTAVFGFTNIVLRAIQDAKPDRVAVAFDLGKPTFRHERYAEYKGTRTRMPDDMREQIPKVREVVKALGDPDLRARGLRGGRRDRDARRPGRDRGPRDGHPDRRPGHAPARLAATRSSWSRCAAGSRTP